jgi:hypothetical protein
MASDPSCFPRDPGVPAVIDNCRSFAEYGGGNFKLSGAGAFAGVSVQRVGVRGRGVLRVTGGGRGRLTIESVCDRWMVKAVAP